jgi:hypothetical protein
MRTHESTFVRRLYLFTAPSLWLIPLLVLSAEPSSAPVVINTPSLNIAGEKILVPAPDGLVHAPAMNDDLKEFLAAMTGMGMNRGMLFVTSDDARAITHKEEPELSQYALATPIEIGGETYSASSAESFATVGESFVASQDRLMQQIRDRQLATVNALNEALVSAGEQQLAPMKLENLGTVDLTDHSLSILTRTEQKDTKGKLVESHFESITILAVHRRLLRTYQYTTVGPGHTKDSAIAGVAAWRTRIDGANGNAPFIEMNHGLDSAVPFRGNLTGTTFKDLDNAKNALLSNVWVFVIATILGALLIRQAYRVMKSSRNRQFEQEQSEKEALRDHNGE